MINLLIRKMRARFRFQSIIPLSLQIICRYVFRGNHRRERSAVQNVHTIVICLNIRII